MEDFKSMFFLSHFSFCFIACVLYITPYMIIKKVIFFIKFFFWWFYFTAQLIDFFLF